ncbi:MAG: RluA family pseudouridine synthase [Treponema sp.]|nr:RluA family pseudouridine synthase [Treponema sp.]
MTRQPADYTTLFVDSALVALNKRSGLSVSADRYNSAAPRLDVIAEKEFGKLYAVHRIDKDTSGIILYARTPDAHRNLSRQFTAHSVQKIYHCIVHGHPAWQTLHVDVPLRTDGDTQHRTVVSRQNGKPAVTDFTRIADCGKYSWIEARPITGRTHQIRAHLAAHNVYIVCDSLYGKTDAPIYLSAIKSHWRGNTTDEQPLVARLALHAYCIMVAHPDTGEPLSITAPYHRDMAAARRQFEKRYGASAFDDRFSTV